MQTPAERRLISTVQDFLQERDNEAILLSIGAGKSVIIEDQLTSVCQQFIVDRLDVDDCHVDHPNVRHSYQCSAEEMKPLDTETYDLAYSNYVLEHIPDLKSAAREIARVLIPGGKYVATLPNPSAPEFLVARKTPFWFHRFARGGTGWHTEYAYRSIGELVSLFGDAGLELTEALYYPCARQYTKRFPVIRTLGNMYDRLIEIVGWNRLKGNVFLVFEKKAKNRNER